MREGAKLRLVIRLKNEADHFLQELVTPGGQAQGAEFPVLFGDVGASNWRPAVSFMTKVVNEFLDFRHRHPVHRFRCRSWCHGAFIRIEASIGHQIQPWIVELSIHVFPWQSLLATFSNDTEDSF